MTATEPLSGSPRRGSGPDAAPHPAGVAPGRARRPGPSRTYDAPGIIGRHVVPRDARRGQRAAHRAGRGAHRLRPRLPRGHLRHVLADDQRPAARPAARHRHLPAPHAQVPRRRHHRDRAVAGRRRSRWSATSSSTARAFDRIIEAGGYITVNDRLGPRRQPHPDPQGGRRRGDGRGGLHRVRRLRGGLPQRVRRSCSRRPRSPTSTCSRRARPSATSRTEAMVDTMEELFGSCTNHGECEAACPKEISIDFIAC